MQDLRSTLMQVLAARMGRGPVPDLNAALLAHLGEGTDQDAVRAVVERLLQQSTGANQARAQEGVGTEDSLGRLRWLLGAAREQMELLQARSDGLASALGACGLCWGNDPVCMQCAGRGRPGWTRPDPAAFALWIEPALQKMTFSRSGTQKRPPGNPSPSAGNTTDVA